MSQTQTISAEQVRSGDTIVANLATTGEQTITVAWPVTTVRVGKVHVTIAHERGEPFTYRRSDPVRIATRTSA